MMNARDYYNGRKEHSAAPACPRMQMVAGAAAPVVPAPLNLDFFQYRRDMLSHNIDSQMVCHSLQLNCDQCNLKFVLPFLLKLCIILAHSHNNAGFD